MDYTFPKEGLKYLPIFCYSSHLEFKKSVVSQKSGFGFY